MTTERERDLRAMRQVRRSEAWARDRAEIEALLAQHRDEDTGEDSAFDLAWRAVHAAPLTAAGDPFASERRRETDDQLPGQAPVREVTGTSERAAGGADRLPPVVSLSPSLQPGPREQELRQQREGDVIRVDL